MLTRRMWQSPLMAALIGSALLMTCLGQARADDTEAAKRNARLQISRLNDDLSKLRGQIIVADIGIATAKAALKAEQNKDNPDTGKVFALAVTVGVAEGIKTNLETEKAAKERALIDWQAYLVRLGG